jgi:hypothetical protein
MMRKILVLLGLLSTASGCMATPAEEKQGNDNGVAKPAPVVLRKARHATALKVAQTLSPDAGALSILFDDLQANADTGQLGGAQLNALLAIPIEGEAGTARISVDARGQTGGQDGSCELALITPSGATRHWSDAYGGFVLNLTADVPVPFVFRVAVDGLCWATKSHSAALLAVDSLDITIERRPDPAMPVPPK